MALRRGERCLFRILKASSIPATATNAFSRSLSSSCGGSWHEESEDERLDLPGLVRLFPVDKAPNRRQSRVRRVPPSKESADVIAQLRIAQAQQQNLDVVVRSKVSRLICKDLKYVFLRFIRDQNFDLAFKIFDLIRKEPWYKPHVTPYAQLIQSYCNAEAGMKPMGRIHQLLLDAEAEGLNLIQHMCLSPIDCCLLQGDFQTCIKIYELTHKSGCIKEYAFYKRLMKAFKQAGFEEQSKKLLADYAEVAQNHLSETQKRFLLIDY